MKSETEIISQKHPNLNQYFRYQNTPQNNKNFLQCSNFNTSNYTKRI